MYLIASSSVLFKYVFIAYIASSSCTEDPESAPSFLRLAFHDAATKRSDAQGPPLNSKSAIPPTLLVWVLWLLLSSSSTWLWLWLLLPLWLGGGVNSFLTFRQTICLPLNHLLFWIRSGLVWCNLMLTFLRLVHWCRMCALEDGSQKNAPAASYVLMHSYARLLLLLTKEWLHPLRANAKRKHRAIHATGSAVHWTDCAELLPGCQEGGGQEVVSIIILYQLSINGECHVLVKEVAPTMLIDVACDVIICYLFFLHNDILLSTCQSHDNSITTYQHCLPRPGIMGGCHCGQRSSCLSSFALARAFQQVLYRLLTASSLRLLGGGIFSYFFTYTKWGHR